MFREFLAISLIRGSVSQIKLKNRLCLIKAISNTALLPDKQKRIINDAVFDKAPLIGDIAKKVIVVQ